MKAFIAEVGTMLAERPNAGACKVPGLKSYVGLNPTHTTKRLGLR